jgi:septation ring formation regulator EzrA
VQKDARIEHLDSCKLTKDQMEKIKVIKTERKKFQADAQTLKKQLHELKKAYDTQKVTVTEMSASMASKSGGPSVEYHISDLKFQLAEVNEQLSRSQAQFTMCKDKLRECSKQMEVSFDSAFCVFVVLFVFVGVF